MNQLTKFLVDGILNEGEQRVIAAYGGGFKPPTAGHFEVVKQALKNHPEIDEFIIYVGSGTRDGITQAESVLIWEIYQTYLPMKVKIEPSKAPIGDILRLGKNNPQDKVYFVLGAREENEGDFEDIKNRTRAIGGKHPNVEVKVITTADKGMSGTNARKAAKVSFEDFAKFLPTELSDDEKEIVYNIVKPVVKESLNEIKKEVDDSMVVVLSRKGHQISLYDFKNKEPLGLINTYGNEVTGVVAKKGYGPLMYELGMANVYPNGLQSDRNGNTEPEAEAVLNKFIKGDSPNIKAVKLTPEDKEYKTEYPNGNEIWDVDGFYNYKFYNPNVSTLKDLIERGNKLSPAERVNIISSTEELYDSIVNENFNKSLNESFYLDIPKFNQPKTIQQYLIENINEISLSKENAVDINGDLTGGTFTVGDITYEYSIKNIPNPYKDLGLFYNIQFTPKGEVISIPKGGKENYIKILSTMYKIIVDFIEKEQPEYVGISSLDNSGGKNYHTVYNRLTTNTLNLIPGYFRKDSNLTFDSPQGKGRFIVLKRKESLNENASYSQDIDIKQRIMQLTQHMLDKGMNIEPLPNVKFVDGDKVNAREFLGKTAYYDPNSATIVLYTEGRHPKDIVRSFSHEMIHHIQNLEGRLGNITTTNTQEDGKLNNIEAEANLKGTMTFRNWTDSLNEGLGDVSLDYIKTKLPKLDSYPKSDIILSKGDFTYINIPQDKDFGMTAEIKAFDQKDGTLVAQSSFDYDKNGKLKGTLDVRPDKRRLGIATEIYKLAEKIIGDTIFPEEKHTEDAEKFWQQKNRSFGPKTDDTLNEKNKPYKHKPITKEILFEEEDKLMVEVVNPDGERFEYEESNIKGLYTYKDSLDNLYFARITYSPSSPPRFEFKVGWFEDNDISKPKYDPQLPPNTTSMDDLKRRNTVAKIYRDEILPYLKDNQKLAKQLDINPISQSRYIFSQRLIQHHTPSEYNIDLKDRKIVISLPKIEEKKNKDPFGLNAYALELAKGLEEEIDKDKKNENVAPNHDGKAAPYGSGYKKINEGRYDTLANQLSKIAFQEFKDIHDRGDEEGTFKFRVDHPDEEHDIPAEEFYFDFEGIVKITDDEYNVDGGANVGFDDKGDEITPILSVKFKIPKNPDWQKVSFDIKDVVRHELEHLTQDGDNEKGGAWHEDPRLRRPSKYMQDDQFLRNLIDANLLPKSDYFKLEKEVDAMLQGMYFKAKKSKTPFKKVLNDYLDIFVDQGSISKEEKENILDVWRSRRKALSLPSF